MMKFFLYMFKELYMREEREPEYHCDLEHDNAGN